MRIGLLLLASAIAGGAGDDARRGAILQVRATQVAVDPTFDAWCRHLDVPPPRGASVTSTGTAFLLGNPPRLITNHHVVAGARTLTLLDADGAVLTVRDDPAAVRPDAQADLALIDVDPDELGARRAGLRLGAAPPRGATVSLLGFADDGPLATRTGRLGEATTRALPGSPERPVQLVDASVAHGMSGGPVLDEAGHVVGVVLAGSTAASELHGAGVIVPRDALAAAVVRLTAGPPLRGDLLGIARDGRVTTAEGRSATLGLRVGDRIVAVAGREVDDVEAALRRRVEPVLLEVAGRGYVVLPGRSEGVTPPTIVVPGGAAPDRPTLRGSGSPRRATSADRAPGSASSRTDDPGSRATDPPGDRR